MGIYKDKHGNIRSSQSGDIEKIWVEDNAMTGSGHYINPPSPLSDRRSKDEIFISNKGVDITDETCATCIHYRYGRHKWVKNRKYCFDGAKYIYSKKQKACRSWDDDLEARTGNEKVLT